VTRLAPLDREDLPQFEDRFKKMEENLGYVPETLFLLGRRPALLETFLDMMLAVWNDGTVDSGLKSLVGMMSSQAAGCRYCEAHQAFRAAQLGTSEEKLADLWEFETSPAFSEAERAALRLARDSSVLPNLVTPEHFEELARYFSADEVVELMSVISAFGFLNRWNDSLATTLEPVPTAFASRVLGPHWNPGRHAPAADA
jgi:alkylhydroperoxidase family enzyme